MKNLALLLCLISFWSIAQCQNIQSPIFDRKAVRECLVPACSFKPIPAAKDSIWQQSLPQDLRSGYIRLGYNYHNKPWNIIPDSIFGEYKATGNQANYQRLNFSIRRQMSCLVMAEIMEHQGLLIGDILNGLDYFIQEVWWGISAHYPTTKPDPNNQVVDLFNAETGNLLAWTIYMLHDELEIARPGICECIKKEIDRRILTPARNVDYSWKTKIDNWNTWICANWLSCILLCEYDRNQQIDDINQVLACLEVFYNGYPNDGGCDEGVHYWDRAAASFYESIRLLGLATNNRFSFADDSKFKAMGSFVYKNYICKNSYVNFADALSNTLVNINILYPYGHYIGDTIMTGFAAMIADEANYLHDPIYLFSNSGNYPSISRELLFLSEYNSFKQCLPHEPLLRDVKLPDLQVFCARSYEKSTNGPFIAVKGGHNAEMHNHNDVGSFIAYCDSEPLLIDIGFATYNSQTFSNKRYELINRRSSYHNTPLINGFEQLGGKQFKAKELSYKFNKRKAVFSLNLEDAYPVDAAIDKWRRSIRLIRGERIEIIEDYRLKKWVQPSEICLILYGEPILIKKGMISFSTDKKPHYLLYKPGQLEPVIERILIDDPAVRDTWSQKPLYRIRLVISNKQLMGKIKYTIQ